MINPITQRLPDFIEIDGKRIKIHTDFRVWIRASLLLYDNTEFETKLVELIKLCYIEIPPTLKGGIEGILLFLSGGEKKTAKENGGHKKALFDFDADAGLIYASFLKEYGIDLSECNMHWYKFLALLNALPQECEFLRIVSYRGTDLSKIKDKEQRAFIRRMKTRYALPDKRSEDEKERDIVTELEGLFNFGGNGDKEN